MLPGGPIVMINQYIFFRYGTWYAYGFVMYRLIA